MPKTPNSKVIIKKAKVYYKDLSKDKAVGFAYQGSEHYIEIDPKQTDKEFFLTHVHELFHLLLPDLSESQIIRIEKTFGSSLWLTVKKLRKKWRDQTIMIE